MSSLGSADELLIRAAIVDELSGPLEGIEAQVNRLAGSVARLDAAGAAAGRGGVAKLGTQVGGLHGLLNKVHQGALNLSRSVGQTFSSMLSKAAFGLGALTAAVGFFGIKSASSFEQTRIALDGLLGSQAKGAAMFKDLQNLNLKTPFGLGSVTAGARQLLGFQFDQAQILPVMKASTDIAAGLGVGEEGLQRILLNLGQVQAAGRVTGRELRDFAVLGVPGYALVGEILGKTKDEVRAMGDDAVVTSDQFVDAWIKMQGPLKMFGGMAEKEMNSLSGLWSNVKDSFQVGIVNATGPLVESLKGVIGPNGPLTTFITQALTTLAPPVAKLGGQLLTSITQLLPALLPVFTALADGATRLLQAMAPGFAALQPVAGELAGSLVELVDALVPVMPDLTTAFVGMVRVLPAFVHLLADIVPLSRPLLELVSGLLEFDSVRQVLAVLLFTLLGYRAIDAVAKTIGAVAGALRGLATAEAEEGAARAGAGGLGRFGGMAALGIGGAASAYEGYKQPGLGVGNTLMMVGGMAATGAAIGSVLPGPGTAIGAGVGAVIGGVMAYSKHNQKRPAPASQTPYIPAAAYIPTPAPAYSGPPQINGPLIGNVENMSTDVDVEAAARRAMAEADRQARERV